MKLLTPYIRMIIAVELAGSLTLGCVAQHHPETPAAEVPVFLVSQARRPPVAPEGAAKPVVEEASQGPGSARDEAKMTESFRRAIRDAGIRMDEREMRALLENLVNRGVIVQVAPGEGGGSANELKACRKALEARDDLIKALERDNAALNKRVTSLEEENEALRKAAK